MTTSPNAITAYSIITDGYWQMMRLNAPAASASRFLGYMVALEQGTPMEALYRLHLSDRRRTEPDHLGADKHGAGGGTGQELPAASLPASELIPAVIGEERE